MKDLFNDSGFNQFLINSGGEIGDLDSDIGKLIYNLYKRKIIQTTFSCSGHIGTYLQDVGYSSRPNTHFLYHEGYFKFSPFDSEKSKRFVNLLDSFSREVSFAHLNKSSNRADYIFILQMDDLVDGIIDKNASKKLGILYSPSKEVEKTLAQKRYSEFVSVWNKLEGIASLI